jgi:hypothetical protein
MNLSNDNMPTTDSKKEEIMEQAFEQIIGILNNAAQEIGTGESAYVAVMAASRYFAFHSSGGFTYDSISERLLVDGATKGLAEAFAVVIQSQRPKSSQLDA